MLWSAAVESPPVTGSRSRRQQRAQRTRVRILEAAAAAFARHGYDGVSLNELIRQSGLTKGAFYFHFASRDELALAAFRYKQQQLVALIVEAIDEEAPPLDRLGAILRERARLLERDPTLFAVVRLGIELTLRHGADSEYASFSELPITLFERIVTDGQSRGDFRPDLDPRHTAETIFAGVLGIDQAALLLPKKLDITARTEWLLDLLGTGLRAGAPTNTTRKDNR
jgi:AcrR family transcriptional regulator